jgi:hypothetical protein
MKAIDIDFDYLLFAYQDDCQDNIYYLDTEYGSIRLVHQGLQDLRDLTDEIEIFHDRFLYIPKAAKDDVIDDLHDFMNMIQDSELKRILTVAFESPTVLESFKKILTKSLPVRQQLENYLHGRAKERLLAWLTANALAVAQEKNKVD